MSDREIRALERQGKAEPGNRLVALRRLRHSIALGFLHPRSASIGGRRYVGRYYSKMYDSIFDLFWANDCPYLAAVTVGFWVIPSDHSRYGELYAEIMRRAKLLEWLA